MLFAEDERSVLHSSVEKYRYMLFYKILIWFGLFVLLSCSKYEPFFSIEETDEHKILDYLANARKNNEPVLFNSYGGKTSVALEVSKNFKDVAVIVNNECSSACAEIILPSAKEIYFKNDPIVSFHGNTISYQYYVENLALKNTIYCNWIYADEQRNLLSEKSINTEFWKEQMKRLKPKVTFDYDVKRCPWRNYNFENDYWLPNSEQLRKLLGLKFNGNVCADSFKKCKKRIDLQWPKGVRVVIGDSVYISQGRK